MEYIQCTNGMKNKNESVDINQLNNITFMKSFICTQYHFHYGENISSLSCKRGINGILNALLIWIDQLLIEIWHSLISFHHFHTAKQYNNQVYLSIKGYKCFMTSITISSIYITRAICYITFFA